MEFRYSVPLDSDNEETESKEFVYEDGSCYIGFCKKGTQIPNGHGKMIFANGHIYEGECLDGMRHGYGK